MFSTYKKEMTPRRSTRGRPVATTTRGRPVAVTTRGRPTAATTVTANAAAATTTNTTPMTDAAIRALIAMVSWMSWPNTRYKETPVTLEMVVKVQRVELEDLCTLSGNAHSRTS